MPIKTTVSSWETIAQANDVVRPGGEWSPADCRNTEKVAIIVPYRDREQHLRIFLNHMHPILRRQKISYRIFVVEQVSFAIPAKLGIKKSAVALKEMMANMCAARLNLLPAFSL